MGVQRQSKQEYMARMQGRYLKAGKREKGTLLDEVVAVTGYHRRHAVRVLRHSRFPDPKLAAIQGLAPPGQRTARRGTGRGGRPPGRPRVYSSVVVGALRVAAEASNWLCGTRLAPFLPELVPALEAEGELRLTAEDRARLLAMSARTLDRRLRLFRLQRDPKNWHGLGTTKPGSLLKHQVPIQTYTPWEDQRPGFFEIDLVAHCGTTTEGFYLNTLTATDVATGWTECIGVWGKSQRAVFAGLETTRGRLPMRLLGLDSDNGSEFLNAHLVRYCTQEQLTFTRRPPWSNSTACTTCSASGPTSGSPRSSSSPRSATTRPARAASTMTPPRRRIVACWPVASSTTRSSRPWPQRWPPMGRRRCGASWPPPSSSWAACKNVRTNSSSWKARRPNARRPAEAGAQGHNDTRLQSHRVMTQRSHESHIEY